MKKVWNLFKNRCFRKSIIPRRIFKENTIVNPKLSSIVYNAETRKYELNVSYLKDGRQDIDTLYYTPSLKYLINDKAKNLLKAKLLHKYGFIASNNIDLALYSVLEEFDSTYNTNYADEYGNRKLSTKLFYDFTKENKYNYMSRKANRKANKTVHQQAKKQIFFVNAKVKKYNTFSIIGPAVATFLTLFTCTKILANDNSVMNDNFIESTSETDNVCDIKTLIKTIETENKKLKASLGETTTSGAISIIENQKEEFVEGSLLANNVNNKNVVEEVDSLEELAKRKYAISSDNMGYVLGEGLGTNLLAEQKLSTYPSKKFGKQKYKYCKFKEGKKIDYIICDGIKYDDFKISEIVVYENDEIIDRINLTTEEKYNTHINELYGIYGPKIKIAVKFDGYRNNKVIKKSIGYIDVEKISCLTDKQKKVLAKKYKPEETKTLTLTR